MLFTFENGVLLMRVVWHHSLLLMNSFNKTEAAVFSCRLCFLRAFPFISKIRPIIIGLPNMYLYWAQLLSKKARVFIVMKNKYETVARKAIYFFYYIADVTFAQLSALRPKKILFVATPVTDLLILPWPIIFYCCFRNNILCYLFQ